MRTHPNRNRGECNVRDQQADQFRASFVLGKLAKSLEDQVLEDNELAAVSGGDMDDLKTQSQLYSFLTSAMDNVIKSIGEGLQSAARKN